MGWESRDWAQWTPEERARFYGSGSSFSSSSSLTAPPREPQPLVTQLRVPARTRSIVWGSVAVLTVAVFGAALALRPVAPVEQPLPLPAHPPAIVYGESGIRPVMPHGSTSPYAPGGSQTVCTAKVIDEATGEWVCTVYRVLQPPPPSAPVAPLQPPVPGASAA